MFPSGWWFQTWTGSGVWPRLGRTSDCLVDGENKACLLHFAVLAEFCPPFMWTIRWLGDVLGPSNRANAGSMGLPDHTLNLKRNDYLLRVKWFRRSLNFFWQRTKQRVGLAQCRPAGSAILSYVTCASVCWDEACFSRVDQWILTTCRTPCVRGSNSLRSLPLGYQNWGDGTLRRPSNRRRSLKLSGRAPNPEPAPTDGKRKSGGFKHTI